ncbi:MAG TPA: DUF5689 domain-containing protein [Chitinophagaceae bacterium]
MLNRSFYWFLGMLFFMTAGLITTSCNKKFDAPPSFVEPDIQANTTIKQLKAMHTMGNIERITEDIIVGGVVVADDKSGNFYKSIAIQDATGGITVRLDGSNLFNSYPVGRKIYIKMKGLYLGDYNKLYQIGGGVDDSDPTRPELAPLASSLFDTYIVKGSTGNTVTPKVVTVDQLHDSLQSMLIQLNGMEFIPADTSKTYADAAGKMTRNLYVKACSGNSLIMRTSGYSTFAGVNVPNGNGTLLSVYTVFGTTKQLVIRDTSDVRFTGPRCGTGPTAEMNIADLRALYTGAATIIGEGKRISGVVISDRVANNQDDNNLVLQQGDGKAGIMIRFSEPHTYDLGDKIEVNVSGQSLEEFNGVMQVNNVPNDFAKKVGTGTITPREATTTEIAANFEAWESTLVKIKNVTITGGTSGTWNNSTTLTDASGTIVGYTRSAATFSGTAYPTGAVQSITGYLSEFKGTQQLLLRTLADVEAGTPPPPPPPPTGNDVLIFSEYVEGSSNNKYLEIYNAGTGEADLSRYTVKIYANGGTTPNATGGTQKLSELTGGPTTLAAGATLVLKNSSAALTLPAGVTAYVSGVTNFNGDDVVELEKDGTVVDVFGEKGVDPGSSWSIAGDAAAATEKAVRRKPGVVTGNTSWAASAGTDAATSEWVIISTQNDVSGLGTR